MGMYGPVEDGIRCGKGATKQSFKDECDVNNILAKYQKTGLLTHYSNANPRFGDFSSVPDYRSSLDLVRKAQEYFMELPAALRGRFKNDPAVLLEFVADSRNKQEAIELGLIADDSKKKAEEPKVVGDAPKA